MNPKNPHNLTEEQIRQGYSTIPGAYDPVTGKLKSPNVITPQDLQPQPKIELPTTPVTVQTQVLNNPYTEYLKSFDLTQSEQQAKDIQMGGLDQYLKDIIGTQGETQAKAEELAKTDYTKLRQDLVTAENRWRELEAEKAKDDITLASQLRAEERRDTLLPFAQMGQAKLAGDAQIVRALKSAEQNMLNARTLALQGNIELAKQTAEEAVALKYAPYKDRIKTYEDIVKAVQPFLNSAEKKELAKQTAKGNLALKEIEQIQDLQKTSLSNAILNGASSSVLDKISKAGSIEEIMSVGSNYLVSPKERLELQKLGYDVKKSQADYLKTIQEINQAKDFLGSSTNDVSGDLILGSSRYAGKQPSAGWIDDFTQAGVTLGNVAELQKLIEKEGQTGIVSGNVKSILGKLSGNFANAKSINAQIQRTVPGLARGIFKEVGVLTDQDIQNYKKTLPNLTSPEQQNKLALLMTYDVIERSIALSLANQAKAKNDVSGYYSDYLNVKNTVNQLKSELGFIDNVPVSPESKSKMEASWNQIQQNASSLLDTYIGQ